jgi:hypothetical protein
LGRAIERFDLRDLDDEFVARWRGEGTDRTGVRDLAEHANVTILDAALEREGVRPLGDDVEHLYEQLTDDGVGSGSRTAVRNRLTTEGVAIEEVESRFVSHQTVHSHLRECLGVERASEERTPAERRADERDRIRTLQGRTEAVTVDALERLDRNGDLNAPAFDVLVDIAVLCRECGRRSELADILDAGGCQCRTED